MNGPARCALVALSALLSFAPATLAASPPSSTATVSNTSVCQGSGTSLDSDGSTIGTATGSPGSKAAADKPFVVDSAGEIRYAGSVPKVLGRGSWEVRAGGIRLKGDDFNNTRRLSKTGSLEIGDRLPIALRGPKVWGEFDVDGSKGRCTGGIWVKFDGSPVGTIPWIVGLASALLGLAGLALSLPRMRPMGEGEAPTLRRRPVRGIVSGLVLGVGAALLAFMHGLLATTSLLPVLGGIVLAFTVVGLLASLLVPARR